MIQIASGRTFRPRWYASWLKLEQIKTPARQTLAWPHCIWRVAPETWRFYGSYSRKVRSPKDKMRWSCSCARWWSLIYVVFLVLGLVLCTGRSSHCCHELVPNSFVVKAQVSVTQPKMGLLSVTALGIFLKLMCLAYHTFIYISESETALSICGWLLCQTMIVYLWLYELLWFSATLWFCRVFPHLYFFPAQCLSLKAC